jgi:hypothetical protein
MTDENDPPPWKLITSEQLHDGWIEMRGVTPVHHDYIVIHTIDDGGRPVYKVRNPELQIREGER